MEGTKSMFASKTVWGGIIAVAAGVVGFLGYVIGADDQAALANHIDSIAAAVGGLIAIYGRVRASKGIG